MTPEEPETTGRVSRRGMLKRLGAGTAIAWSTPIITSLGTPAHAGSPACSLSASMNGAQEAPFPTVTPATGSASFSVSLVPSQVDWSYSYQNLTTQCVAAHVHRAPAGAAGPVVINLGCPDGFPTSGSKSGTSNVDPALAVELCGNPALFYINVHSQTYPGGEIRGQLS